MSQNVTIVPALPLIDEKQAARLCGFTVRGMQAKRLNGTGPRYIKLGRAVRYRPESIQQWLESQSVSSTCERDESARDGGE